MHAVSRLQARKVNENRKYSVRVKVKTNRQGEVELKAESVHGVGKA